MSLFLKAYEEKRNLKTIKEQRGTEFVGRLDYQNIEVGNCIVYNGNVIGQVENVIFPDKSNNYKNLINFIEGDLENIVDRTKGVSNLEDIIPMVYDEEEEEYVFNDKVDAPILSAPFIEIYGFGGRGDYSYASLIEDCGISFLGTNSADNFSQNISL